jgi:putative peptidoglycan lipid II flippase
MLEVCARAFYAQQDTRTPLYVAAGAMAINVAASLVLREWLGAAGLALGNSIGVSVEVLALLLITRRRLQGVDERRIGIAFARFVAGSLVMASAIAALQSVFTIWPLPDGLPIGDALRPAIEIGIPLVASAAVGLIVYIVVASAMGSEEVRALPRWILRRRTA